MMSRDRRVSRARWGVPSRRWVVVSGLASSAWARLVASVLWSMLVVVLLGCRDDLGTPRGVSIAGLVGYEGEAHLSLEDPRLVVSLYDEGLKLASALRRYASTQVFVEGPWPDEGLAFRLDYILPGRYRISARLSAGDGVATRPLARTYLSGCPLDELGRVLVVEDRPVAGQRVQLRDVADAALLCPAAGTLATGDGGVEAGTAEDDPYAGFGRACTLDPGAVMDGSFSSRDCSGRAHYCAASPGESDGFCTAGDCSPEDPEDTTCPPGWPCIDVSIFVPGGGTACVDPSFF